MNSVLLNKLNELQKASDYECWYLVKQPTAFDNICYLVSFLKEFKSKGTSENLQEFIGKRVAEVNSSKPDVEIPNNYRALRVAAFFGLITMTSTKYEEATITDAFEEINIRCGGEFERKDLYEDIIQRQIEKMYISSTVDEGYNGVRQNYRLYPVMLLYKVLIELGRATGNYSISMTEYRYLVATTKVFENFLETLLLINLLREDPSANAEFEQYRTKFDNRLIQALKQLPTLVIDRESIKLNPDTISEVAKKVFAFESDPNVFTTGNYMSFLGSTKSLFDLDSFENENKYSKFTPEWFREKAKEYPTLDEEANQLRLDFINKFSPEYLSSLSGEDLLTTMFLNDKNENNLCRVLEFDPQIKEMFGSIKGGTAYKYGLYYSNKGSWMTGSSQKQRQLTVEEAVEVGTKIRDHLIAGAETIQKQGEFNTIEDYKKLYEVLKEVTEGEIDKVWFLKYYQMVFPKYFATNYSSFAQSIVLKALNIEKEEHSFVCMGQIRFYADKCGISNEMFNKIFWTYYVDEESDEYPERQDDSYSKDVNHNTGLISEFSRNRILFGAPGTGKSYTLNKEKDSLLSNGGEYERVTFHPDYSYANFVGTYKPVPCKDKEGNDAITYSYVPGPFMRTYVKALLNSRTDAPKPFLLVIEEINRANVAAVFGDVFQLLDRGDDEVSEYPIQASEDIKKYLADSLDGENGNPEDYAEIRIPDNMFIWATMNSADQGVFPMDTAFKRRWDFTYLGIDDSEDGIVGKRVILGKGEHRKEIEWNALRKAINEELLTYKVNEDKLMGPYFISKKILSEGDTIDSATFTRVFKNKVIMYLFDDAAKQKRLTLFGGCSEKDKSQYSKICDAFDSIGVDIFCDAISSRFIDVVTEEDGE